MQDAQHELLNNKIDALEKLINEKFNGVAIELDYIKKQTTKTNGRVNNLEAFKWKIVGISLGASTVMGFAIKYMFS